MQNTEFLVEDFVCYECAPIFLVYHEEKIGEGVMCERFIWAVR